MPIIKSAKKRVKTARKASARNAKTKRVLREATKAFNNALASGNKTAIEKAHREVISAIDMAAKKAVLHKNKAARKKSQLAAKTKKAGVKSSPKPAQKPTAKKSVTNKIPAKKTTAKKTSSKK